jgi:hypothetical protein
MESRVVGSKMSGGNDSTSTGTSTSSAVVSPSQRATLVVVAPVPVDRGCYHISMERSSLESTPPQQQQQQQQQQRWAMDRGGRGREGEVS